MPRASCCCTVFSSSPWHSTEAVIGGTRTGSPPTGSAAGVGGGGGGGMGVERVLDPDASRRTVKANAYVTGFGRTKRIVLYDTLLTRASSDEVEAVLAHEMGHRMHH